MNAHWVDRLAAYLRYHDLPGADPAVVFLHGLGSASSSYFLRAAVYPRLRDSRRLLIDLLGFGYSDRPRDFDYTMEAQAALVVGLLCDLGISDCTLVGHSMGGSIAILVATAAPGIVGRVVVAEGNLDPGPGMLSGPITSWTEREFAAAGHRQLIEQVRGAALPDFAGTLQACDPIALHRSAVSLIASRRPTYREQLARLTLARTFIYGDKNVPNPNVDRLIADGVVVRVLAGSGHDMLVDNPDGFAEIVADAVEPGS